MITPFDALTAIIEDCDVSHAEAERLADEAMRGRYVSDELAMYLDVGHVEVDVVRDLLNASALAARGLALHDDLEGRLLARMEAINAKYEALHPAPKPDIADA